MSTMGVDQTTRRSRVVPLHASHQLGSLLEWQEGRFCGVDGELLKVL